MEIIDKSNDNDSEIEQNNKQIIKKDEKQSTLNQDKPKDEKKIISFNVSQNEDDIPKHKKSIIKVNDLNPVKIIPAKIFLSPYNIIIRDKEKNE